MDWKLSGRVLVLIDAANLSHAAEDLGFKIRYRQLARFFRTETDLVRVVYYSSEFETEAHAAFILALRKYGYQIESKPVKVISRGRGAVLRKANFDVEITLDAMDWLGEYDTLALFSGDSDFHALVRRLQAKGKKIVVCSMRNHIARELIASADHYIDVSKLSHDVVQRKR